MNKDWAEIVTSPEGLMLAAAACDAWRRLDDGQRSAVPIQLRRALDSLVAWDDSPTPPMVLTEEEDQH
jgi:hypothetical protein